MNWSKIEPRLSSDAFSSRVRKTVDTAPWWPVVYNTSTPHALDHLQSEGQQPARTGDDQSVAFQVPRTGKEAAEGRTPGLLAIRRATRSPHSQAVSTVNWVVGQTNVEVEGRSQLPVPWCAIEKTSDRAACSKKAVVSTARPAS